MTLSADSAGVRELHTVFCKPARGDRVTRNMCWATCSETEAGEMVSFLFQAFPCTSLTGDRGAASAERGYLRAEWLEHARQLARRRSQLVKLSLLRTSHTPTLEWYEIVVHADGTARMRDLGQAGRAHRFELERTIEPRQPQRAPKRAKRAADTERATDTDE